MATQRLADSALAFRRALGHYPTGVAVISATGADGERIGMVVGTFTSVSLDPPLVGFLPDLTSTSWPRIRAAGRFCVNVLTADQEEVCRAFSSKSPDRWDRYAVAETSSGPRLGGVALFLECEIEQVHPAGDHEFVLGRVHHVEVGDTPEMPLVFLRGGYGSPRIPSLQYATTGLVEQLRLADLVRAEAESIASDLGLECRVTARDGQRVVVVGSAGFGNLRRERTVVGASLPLIAPFAPLFIAGARDSDKERWFSAGRAVFGEEITAVAADLLAQTADGVEEMRRQDINEKIEGLIARGDNDFAAREAFPDLVGEQLDLADRGLSSLAVPVHDAGGSVVLVLQVVGFRGDETREFIDTCRNRIQLGGRAAEERVVSAAQHDS